MYTFGSRFATHKNVWLDMLDEKRVVVPKSVSLFLSEKKIVMFEMCGKTSTLSLSVLFLCSLDHGSTHPIFFTIEKK